MKPFKIIGLGEIIWDMLPSGKQLGGAPANFAYHAMQLGAEAYVISAVGKDNLGKEILHQIHERGLNSLISITDYPTGTVDVEVTPKGIPTYTIHENVAWDHIPATEKVMEVAKEADAICFGSLAQRFADSRKTIISILEASKENCIKVFDINLRLDFYTKEVLKNALRHADILKINEEELPILAYEMGWEVSDEFVLPKLIRHFDLELVAFTKGENGSILINDSDVSELPTPKVEVADTIGAGDSFTAALIIGLLMNKPLQEIHQKAVDVSAFVCTQHGAMPKLPEHLKY
ncbi:carbohydrate kinase [Limibacter armeniacum]|uniref:carbohydrate kinase family protein n=1 Tax=Limibacter armeniacum TaxID=466084 RepID=UPI002FE5C24E